MKDILETLKANRDCSKFYALIHKAEVQKKLTGAKKFTVFVPNNKACDCVDDKKMLQKHSKEIVTYHILPGKIKAIDLVPYKLRKTLHGKEVCLEAVTVQVNAAIILKKDIECSNGYIHIIDQILVPRRVNCVPRTNYYNYEKRVS